MKNDFDNFDKKINVEVTSYPNFSDRKLYWRLRPNIQQIIPNKEGKIINKEDDRPPHKKVIIHHIKVDGKPYEYKLGKNNKHHINGGGVLTNLSDSENIWYECKLK